MAIGAMYLAWVLEAPSNGCENDAIRTRTNSITRLELVRGLGFCLGTNPGIPVAPGFLIPFRL